MISLFWLNSLLFAQVKTGWRGRFHWHHHLLGDAEYLQDDYSAARTTLRFDANGKLTFMQHKLTNYRQQILEEEVSGYQYQANKILINSESLLAGHIHLRQDQWRGEGRVKGCNGNLLYFQPDPSLQQKLQYQSKMEHYPYVA